MDRVKNYSIAVILGSIFAWGCVWITGIGAAIAVPAEILKPVSEVSGLLALALVDFFTIAVPVSVAFLIVALFSRLLNKNPNFLFYLLLLTPLVFLQIYFFFLAPLELTYVMVTMLPRYLLLAVCVYFLLRSTRQASA